MKKVEKSFVIFQKACEIGCRELGIARFKRYYRNHKLEGAHAQCSYDLESCDVYFTLNNGQKYSDRMVIESAAHECLELLMADERCYIVGNNMMSPRYEILRHAIIRSLEHVLADKIESLISKRRRVGCKDNDGR